MGSLELKPVADRDWAAIDVLADVAVQHLEGAPSQHAWSMNRRTMRGCRRHQIAVRDGAVVGYGGIERSVLDPPHDFRVFLVLDWSNPAEVADRLVAQIERDLAALEASTAWLREYAADAPLVDFFVRRGFSASPPYEVGGEQIITLRRPTGRNPRITRATSFTEADQTALGVASGDVFGVEDLGLEWRRKDIHFTWYADDGPIAHVGLVDGIIADFDHDATRQVLGVGSVVTRPDRQRQGYSQRLLAHALSDTVPFSASSLAMLFCQHALTGFYAGQGWQVIDAAVWTRQGNAHVPSPLQLMCKPLREGIAVPTVNDEVRLHERHW